MPSLPECIAITGPAASDADFAEKLTAALQQSPDAVLFRARELPQEAWRSRRRIAGQLCRQASVPLVLACSVPWALQYMDDARGLHLTGQKLKELAARPVADDRWLGASCHSVPDLRAASHLKCDYAFLSPVLEAKGSETAMGFSGLASSIARADTDGLAVYALGGLGPEHLPQVRAAGARGLAGIRWCWPDD